MKNWNIDVRYSQVLGVAITWDFIYEKEIMIMLPFLIIIINFNNDGYEM